MTKEMKTVLGLLAFMGLAALVYSTIKRAAPVANTDRSDEQTASKENNKEVNGSKENKYDSFLEERDIEIGILVDSVKEYQDKLD